MGITRDSEWESNVTYGNIHYGPIYSLKFNRTGNYILSGGQDTKINLINRQNGQLLQNYLLHSHPVIDLEISRDSSMFASGSQEGTIFLWNVSRGGNSDTLLRLHRAHFAQVNDIAFNDNESVLASASLDGTVKLWDLRNRNTYKPIQVLKDSKDGVSGVSIFGHQIISVSNDEKIRTYDLRTGQLITDHVRSSVNKGVPLSSLTVSMDGDTALVTSLDSVVRLFDLQTGTVLEEYTGHRNTSLRLRAKFSDNDSKICCASEDGRLCIWDLMKANHMSSLQIEEPSKALLSYDITVQSREYLAAALQKGSIAVYEKKSDDL